MSRRPRYGKEHYCGRSGALSSTTVGAIFLRDAWSCAYCGARVRREAIHLDHVIPRSQGGKSVAGNLVVTCADCNLERGSGPVPPHARREVKRRLALPLDRAAGKELGDRLYPTAPLRREKKRAENKRRREEAKRVTEAEGLGGRAFPFGECAI